MSADKATKAFTVVRAWTEMVPTRRKEVLAETDDPVEAHVIAQNWARAHPRDRRDTPHVRGEHPTHEWVEDTCVRCNSPRIACFKAQMPCGHKFDGAFFGEMERWRQEHEAKEGDTTDAAEEAT